MAAMWKLGADEQLAMCALVNPEALAPLDAMCQKFPETPVVIDHFARIGVDGTDSRRRRRQPVPAGAAPAHARQGVGLLRAGQEASRRTPIWRR